MIIFRNVFLKKENKNNKNNKKEEKEEKFENITVLCLKLAQQCVVVFPCTVGYPRPK